MDAAGELPIVRTQATARFLEPPSGIEPEAC